MRIQVNDTGRYRHALVARVGREGRIIGLPAVRRGEGPGAAPGGRGPAKVFAGGGFAEGAREPGGRKAFA
jgi:hypothetical protein